MAPSGEAAGVRCVTVGPYLREVLAALRAHKVDQIIRGTRRLANRRVPRYVASLCCTGNQRERLAVGLATTAGVASEAVPRGVLRS